MENIFLKSVLIESSLDGLQIFCKLCNDLNDAVNTKVPDIPSRDKKEFERKTEQVAEGNAVKEK